MSPSNPERPWQPRKHDEPERILNPFEHTAEPERLEVEHREAAELDPLEDAQDPPDPSEASDPETVANANASR
jgi:hypothetical protein